MVHVPSRGLVLSPMATAAVPDAVVVATWFSTSPPSDSIRAPNVPVPPSVVKRTTSPPVACSSLVKVHEVPPPDGTVTVTDVPFPTCGSCPVVRQTVPAQAQRHPGAGVGRFSATVHCPAVRPGIVPVPAFCAPGCTVRLTVDVVLVGLVTV